ncbi:MAG: flagellin [Desulfurococcales archaeon]|nr:flagellin [Desulfurococcales archaeon]
MGESTVITHAMLTILAITITSIFAGIIITASYRAGNTISSVLNLNTEKVSTDVDLVYISKTSTSSGYLYEIYLKNVGTQPLSSLDSMDVFIGNYTEELYYFKYNSTASNGEWNYTIIGGTNGIWDQKETLVIYAYSQYSFGPLIEVRVVLPTGGVVSSVESVG